MKKLLLSLAFATALTAPAIAGDVTNKLDVMQVGVNNAALNIQNVSGDDIKINADSFKNIDAALDLGEVEIQNVAYVIGDRSEIEGVQQADDIEEGATVLNGGLDVEIEDVKIDAKLENNKLALGL